MKGLIVVMIVVLDCSGCSKSVEKSKSEQLGEDLAGQVKAPIEKARIALEKAPATRGAEMPK